MKRRMGKKGKGGGRKAGDGPLSMKRNHMMEIGYIDNSRTPLAQEEKREKRRTPKGSIVVTKDYIIQNDPETDLEV